ncbi:unnamed protein product, partial [Amoebophrya sp. A120]
DGHGGDSLPLPASSGSRARVGLGGPGRGSAGAVRVVAVRQPSPSREDEFVDLETGINHHSAAGRASARPVSETNGLLSRAAESVASAASRFGEAVDRWNANAERWNAKAKRELEDERVFNAFEQKLADCWDNNS